MAYPVERLDDTRDGRELALERLSIVGLELGVPIDVPTQLPFYLPVHVGG